MTDTDRALRLDYVDERAHPEIGPLLNALATIVNTLIESVDILHERLDALEEHLGLDDAPPWIVDTPDIATYDPTQEPTP